MKPKFTFNKLPKHITYIFYILAFAENNKIFAKEWNLGLVQGFFKITSSTEVCCIYSHDSYG